MRIQTDLQSKPLRSSSAIIKCHSATLAVLVLETLLDQEFKAVSNMQEIMPDLASDL
jgi:hypothetical protein